MRTFEQGQQLCAKQCGSDCKYDRNLDKGRSECTRLLCQSKMRLIILHIGCLG